MISRLTNKDFGRRAWYMDRTGKRKHVGRIKDWYNEKEVAYVVLEPKCDETNWRNYASERVGYERLTFVPVAKNEAELPGQVGLDV